MNHEARRRDDEMLKPTPQELYEALVADAQSDDRSQHDDPKRVGTTVLRGEAAIRHLSQLHFHRTARVRIHWEQRQHAVDVTRLHTADWMVRFLDLSEHAWAPAGRRVFADVAKGRGLLKGSVDDLVAALNLLVRGRTSGCRLEVVKRADDG